MSSRCACDFSARFLVLTVAAVIFFLSRNGLEAAQLSLQTKGTDYYRQQHEKHLLFTISQKRLLNEKDISSAVQLPEFKTSTWPLATISYKIHPNLEKSRSKIENAFRHWEQSSCLLFSEVPYQSTFSGPHLLLQTNTKTKRCKTYFGLSQGIIQPQPMYVGKGCNESAEISRLIGYSVGVLLEQDKSVVHGKQDYNQYIGQSTYAKEMIPSFKDIEKTSNIYKCTKNYCKNKACKNGGILTQSCRCVCPPGTIGDVCEKANLQSMELQKCGGKISRPALLESPTYPKSYIHGLECVWIITPEEGHGVELVVNDFDMGDTPGCLGDHVTISKQHQISGGKRYCGTALQPNDVLTQDADHNIVVKFRTSSQGTGRGFSFNVYFSEEYLELGTVSSVPDETI